MSGPTLNLPFATAGNSPQRRPDSHSTEPDWLLADRLRRARALQRWSCPSRRNQLFTLYVDLRSARFDEIEPYLETGDAAPGLDGAARGRGRPHRDRRGPRRRSRAQRRGAPRPASCSTRSLRRACDQRPELLPKVKELVESGSSLPDDDKFAQFARALSAIGVLVHVPPASRSTAPIVIRWAMAASRAAASSLAP